MNSTRLAQAYLEKKLLDKLGRLVSGGGAVRGCYVLGPARLWNVLINTGLGGSSQAAELSGAIRMRTGKNDVC